ncbi:MAG: dihydrolipoamide acetyltransferase family protein, partial [Mycobacterium sp.]
MPDVLMPRLSDTMTEGVISTWLKHEGDHVERGEVLAEIETDKATMELEAYDSGILTRIIAPAGTTVPIGQPIAVIGTPSDTAGTPSGTAGTQSGTAEAEPSADNTPEPVAAPHIRATPLVRSLAREHGIDLRTVTGSGPEGRIVRADIDAVIAEISSAAAESTGAVTGVLVPTRAESTAGLDGDERVPLTSIRRITAQRLTESAGAPHFYLTSVADVGALETLRVELNEQLPAGRVKISITDLLIRACAVALPVHLDVNSSWGGDHLVRHHRVNIGCAVAVDSGLVVPVIRDANCKGLNEIATEAHTLIDRARAGRLTPDELSGGTFTISNLGMYGIDHFTAVINPPEAAILAVGAVVQEAVVRDGQLTAASTLKLTLSIDHRV